MQIEMWAGSVSALKTLKGYTTKLYEKCDEKAFRYFSKADMRVLSED